MFYLTPILLGFVFEIARDYHVILEINVQVHGKSSVHTACILRVDPLTNKTVLKHKRTYTSSLFIRKRIIFEQRTKRPFFGAFK